jgi:pantoate--beta-alanine ligase
MKLVESIADLRAARGEWGLEKVAFVPTMGALHEGHLSLIEKAKSMAPHVVVSIYVNPLQFGPNEDFDRYPRSLEQDLKLCKVHGVDLVFYPDLNELHPEGFDNITHVVPPSLLVNQLCGLTRPRFFTGVATIVLKLFGLVEPDYAIFGEKDAQQLAVVERMVYDLNLPVKIIPAPTAREYDALAKSSRNKYLQSSWERQQARLLSRLLMTVQELYQQGMLTTPETLALAKERVLDESLYPDFQLEYLAAVDSETFMPVEILEDNTRILVAAKVGHVRLIDNTLLGEPIRLEPEPNFLTQTL